MNNRWKAMGSLILCLLLAAGCSPQSNEQAHAESARNGVFGDQIKALDKAKQVQNIVQDRAGAERKAIEQQSR